MKPMIIKTTLVKLHWFSVSQLGIDPLRFFNSLRGISQYLHNWVQFQQNCSEKMLMKPCLHDRYEEGGTTKSEYFWQDLLVARWIHEDEPEKHVDVGSRVDGFVAHVASFREVEVFDVRPITTTVPGVVFKQADLMQEAMVNDSMGDYCDSLSCLHALEHFGLGRYGDPIDPLGYKKGIVNMAALLKPGGTFYLSVPIGRERVEFDANWVFDPRTILHLAESNGLALKMLTVINNGEQQSLVHPNDKVLKDLAETAYCLGIFTFARLDTKLKQSV
ncbi:MAG: DUF268 domain-containing protein [Cyanobacteria bacterium P01_B01_bin.77]